MTDTRLDATARASRHDLSAQDRVAIGLAGAAYVAAWVIGLIIAPSAPSSTASDATVQAFFADNQSATLIQALLVHGVAGVALAVFVVSLARYLSGDRSNAMRRLFVLAGVGAAVVSLLQVALEISLNRYVAGNGAANRTAALFHAVNTADTVKLVLLGVAIGGVTRLASQTAAFPSWLSPIGYALLPILVVGGLAFVIDSGALSAILDLSLVLLLVWVAAVSVVTTRAPKT